MRMSGSPESIASSLPGQNLDKHWLISGAIGQPRSKPRPCRASRWRHAGRRAANPQAAPRSPRHGKHRNRQPPCRRGRRQRTRRIPRRDAAAPAREQVKEMQKRQRDEFGGLHWGSAFFGWLVAVGIATLLTAIVSAAGAAVGLTQGASTQDATTNADTIGIVGGIVLLGDPAHRLLRRRLCRRADVALQWSQAGPRSVDHRARGDRHPGRRRGGARRGIQRPEPAQPPAHPRSARAR